MEDILIVKNISVEGPGLLQGILEEQRISFEVVDLEKGETLPDPSGFKGIVVLGGPDSANDQTDKILAELEFIKKVVELNIPYLGICLGLQLLVRACGGEVFKNPIKEIGLRDPEGDLFRVFLTPDGKKDKLFEGLADNLIVFQLHGDTVSLVEDMTLLAIGSYCRDQVVRVGENAYGIQCHFELTPEMFEAWATNDLELAKLDKTELLKDFEIIKEEYIYTGKKLLNNFLKVAGFNV